jgi:glycosyltransferase involved in cell wall biosynthesis
LEAMACGCPIVTSTQGSCPEVVAGAGVLVNPRDSADIAAGIYKVLTDRELAAGLVARGYQRVAQFSWEKCARETLDVITSVARAGQATEARLPGSGPS